MTVPFDTDTIFGWYTFWFIQMAISIVYGLCTGSIVSYFFCCCLYIATLCDHFGYIVKSIDENIAKYRATTNSWKIGRIIQQIEQQMHDAIKAHIKMNEWECFFFSLESILTLFEFGIKMHQITSLFFRIFSIFSDINSGVIFSLLPINVLFMAVSLYNFEYASIEHLNWQLIDFHFEKKERNIFTRFFSIFFLPHNFYHFKVKYIFFSNSVKPRCNTNCHQFIQLFLFAILAIHCLLSRNIHHRSHFNHSKHSIRIKLVWTSCKTSKILGTHYRASSSVRSIVGIQSD